MHKEEKLENFTKWLRVVIALTIMALIIEVLFIFLSDVPITLKIDGEYWTKNLASFSLYDHLFITVAINVLNILWLGILLVFWRLCSLYARNQVFTVENALCFSKIGWLLIGMFIWDVLKSPLIGAYLIMQGITNNMPDWDLVLLLNWDYLVPGLIFILMSKIMKYAAMMREESDLTI